VPRELWGQDREEKTAKKTTRQGGPKQRKGAFKNAQKGTLRRNRYVHKTKEWTSITRTKND